MASFNINRERLRNQRLVSPDCNSPQSVVSWLGAVQAQDYYGAKWAVGQRMNNGTDDEVEKAFAAGEILRTHVLRPTWHFIVPADIRWLLRLSSARIIAATTYNCRKRGLDNVIFSRSRKVMEKALRGGKQLSRNELRTALNRAGIATDFERLIHLLVRAEVEGVICSGARKGKQFTYALLDERVPESESSSPTEPLGELAQRYFMSRGPATLQDFVWWSGLTVTDARKGLAMVQSQLVKEKIDGKEYWFQPSNSSKVKPGMVHFLPAYDEFLVGYKDRSAVIPSSGRGRDNPLFSSTILLDGCFIGTWKRVPDSGTVDIQLGRAARNHPPGIKRALKRYAAFLGVSNLGVEKIAPD
jgi:hypothetical protein